MRTLLNQSWLRSQLTEQLSERSLWSTELERGLGIQSLQLQSNNESYNFSLLTQGYSKS